MLKLNGRKGFTLIEILLVLTLLGIVISLLAPRVMGGLGKGKTQATKIQIKQLEGDLDRYRLDCNRYPNTEQGLQALLEKPTAAPDCKNYDPNGYLAGKKKALNDTWDTPFKYESDGSKYKITSLGADGVEGGDGENKDISSDDE